MARQADCDEVRRDKGCNAPVILSQDSQAGIVMEIGGCYTWYLVSLIISSQILPASPQ